MTEPEWLSLDLVIAFHAEQLKEFGGPEGIRDVGALESALGRPPNKFADEGAQLPELAAAYAFGIARNHPFVDGNKRAALLALVIVLDINGVEFDAPEEEAAAMILGLAAGEISEAGLSQWIRDRWPS